ncbi:MAG TPA: ABC transporter ATP-binding protein [Thermoplasmatales archaeon]|nr:ABC transporter ATP-binding protein [Thermoplasmatales archaeon]
MIRIEDVSKKWENFALRNISLEIEKGEYFVILGPTGAGKTLLLETIAGFHEPDDGKIYVDGEDITHLPPNERKMGFVYQDYMLFPHMTVMENIAYGLRIRDMEKNEIMEKINELAKMLHIEHILERYPSNLSGGEQQRVALARALAIAPKIILLDEPLSALDEMLKSEVIKDLKRINKKSRITFIHVTHSRNDAVMLADKMAIMKDGAIVQVGKTGEIFRKPQSKFVAEFVGVENLFEGEALRKGKITVFRTNGIEIYSSSSMEGKGYASIRPEDIIISRKKVESSARNCIEGVVKEVSDMGNLIRVNVDCGMPFMVNITRESMEEMKISVGERIYLIFKAQNVHLFK